MMPCPIDNQQPETILDYVSNKLTGANRTALENHAADCVRCQTMIAEQAALWSRLDEFDAVEASPEFDRRLYRKIAGETQDAWWVRFWRRLFYSGEPGAWRTPALASAVCAIVLAVVLVQSPGVRRSTPVALPANGDLTATATDTPDVESVESALEDLEMLKLVGNSKL